MAKTVDVVINIPVEEDEMPLRGKFTIKTKLSMAEILGQDAIRRQLLGPNPDGVGAEAAAVAYAVSKIRTYTTDAPSWWKDADEGLKFEDINIPLIILGELDKALAAETAKLSKKATAATEVLKKEVAK